MPLDFLLPDPELFELPDAPGLAEDFPPVLDAEGFPLFAGFVLFAGEVRVVSVEDGCPATVAVDSEAESASLTIRGRSLDRGEDWSGPARANEVTVRLAKMAAARSMAIVGRRITDSHTFPVVTPAHQARSCGGSSLSVGGEAAVRAG